MKLSERITPADLREPRLGIHEDGTEELKDWGTLYDQCDKAADTIEQLEEELEATRYLANSYIEAFEKLSDALKEDK